ncbi:MAG: 6-phosphogluconolactonase, partial [Mesorhizobium sp.]
MAREQLSEVSYGWNGFADRQDLATALAGEIADRLTRAITERGAALLAVSGGTTPAKLFAALSTTPITWDKVI